VEQKLRRIVVDGETFFWKVFHRHNVIVCADGETTTCAERLTIWHSEHRRSPFRLDFPWNSKFGGPAYIEQTGVAIAGCPPTHVINLHLPSIVAKIIPIALENGWLPKTQNKPFFIQDGYFWLKEIGVIIGHPLDQIHPPEELSYSALNSQVEDCPSI
jgi:hypothetical protein